MSDQSKIEWTDATWNPVRGCTKADAVLWSFGVWVLSVSAQLMRFVELVFERNDVGAFAGKSAGILSTSIHYFDHLAHNYVRAISEDLGMSVCAAASFGMVDLRSEQGRRRLASFGQSFVQGAMGSCPSPRLFAPECASTFVYTPRKSEAAVPTGGKRLLVLSDASDDGSNLSKMVGRFTEAFGPGDVEVVSLADIEMRSACLGCMRCGYDNTCVQKDGFAQFYNERVRRTDILVLCGQVRHRYLSAQWKTFFDRAFFWNHTPSLQGKQIAYIVSGPLRENHNLLEILEAHVTARQLANFVGVVSDEEEDSARIDALLDDLARRLVSGAEAGYVQPFNFLAVAGMKVFRDEIWGRLRGIWQADYRHFKRHGMFDFPQRRPLLALLGSMLMLLCKIPGIRRRFYAKLQGMPRKRMEAIATRNQRGTDVEELGLRA